MTHAGRTMGPPAARFLPPGAFYGWYVVTACAFLMLLGVGVGYYGLPVFLQPLREAHGWSTTQVSWAPAIYFCVAGAVSAFVGPIIDRQGPLRLITGGLIISGICAAAVGLVNELWQLYAVYFVFAIAFGMSGGVAVQAIVTRWFIRRRAMAMGISGTGVSMGGVVIPPVTSALIDAGGLELATLVLGIAVIVFGVPIALLVLAWDPRDMGLFPDGDATAAYGATASRSAEQRAQYQRWTAGEAARTVSFWAVLVAFVLVLVAQTGYVIHQVAFLEARLGSRSEAALTISVGAAASIVARMGVATFADRVDHRLLTSALMLIQATAVVLIVQFENVPLTWMLTLVFGFTLGNIYMMQSLVVGGIFGMVSFGTIFGLVIMATQISSGFGPLGVGWLHDRTDGYGAPFMVTATLTYAAAVVILLARPVRPPGAATPEPDG